MKVSLNVLSDNEISLEGQKCLDIGCALGEGTEMLHQAGAVAVGADFSAKAIALCRTTYPHLRFEQWDIREVPEDFDIIITNHTIKITVGSIRQKYFTPRGKVPKSTLRIMA